MPSGEEYEHSEMLLYKASVLEEDGKYEQALDCLRESAEHLKDPLGLKEAQARLLVKLQRTSEAAKLLRSAHAQSIYMGMSGCLRCKA